MYLFNQNSIKTHESVIVLQQEVVQVLVVKQTRLHVMLIQHVLKKVLVFLLSLVHLKMWRLGFSGSLGLLRLKLGLARHHLAALYQPCILLEARPFLFRLLLQSLLPWNHEIRAKLSHMLPEWIDLCLQLLHLLYFVLESQLLVCIHPAWDGYGVLISYLGPRLGLLEGILL